MSLPLHLVLSSITTQYMLLITESAVHAFRTTVKF